jgi:predicted RNA binding protein YcfA (HicA-like mRNA interferase family)
VTGSHHIYAKPGDPARISGPVHGNTSLKIGLLRHLMKLSGISEDEL